MALDNLTEVLGGLSPEVLGRVDSLITILKAAGILIIIYFVILILKWIFGFLRHRKIKKMDRKIDEIDRKVDLLLEKRGHHAPPEHKEKPEKPAPEKPAAEKKEHKEKKEKKKK